MRQSGLVWLADLKYFLLGNKHIHAMCHCKCRANLIHYNGYLLQKYLEMQNIHHRTFYSLQYLNCDQQNA